MTHDELAGALAQQVASCAEKLEESLVMGKPSEAESYANCLLMASQAYTTVVAGRADDNEADDD